MAIAAPINQLLETIAIPEHELSKINLIKTTPKDKIYVYQNADGKFTESKFDRCKSNWAYLSGR